MRNCLLACALSLLAATAIAQTGALPSPGPFDGQWNVRIDCPSNTEESGAKGYSYDFPATVANGVIAGSHGEEDTSGFLRIDGAISAEGDAMLRARGRTGNPDYAAKKPSPGTAYHYLIRAHFDRSKGTGTRMETRVCNFVFTK